MKQTKYKVGDRVMADHRSLHPGGSVIKASPVHVVVCWDGRSTVERMRVENLRPEVPADVVARTAYEHAVTTWREQRPKTTHLHILTPRRRRPRVVMQGHLEDPVHMREAAEEFRALADWFDKKPPPPSPANDRTECPADSMSPTLARPS